MGSVGPRASLADTVRRYSYSAAVTVLHFLESEELQLEAVPALPVGVAVTAVLVATVVLAPSLDGRRRTSS